MKNLILFCAAVCAAAFADINQSFAQSTQPRLGIKAGVDLTSITTTTSGSSTTKYNYRAGVQVGLFAEFQLSKQFSVSPQFLFTQKGGNEGVTSSSFGSLTSAGSYKVQINYLDIPVLFIYKVQPKLVLCVGPQVGLLLSQKTSYTNNIGGVPQSFAITSTAGFRKAPIGGNVGVGYKVCNHAGINLNYMFDLQKMLTNNYAKGAKNHGFALTASYLF
jgi:hypothetical protein